MILLFLFSVYVHSDGQFLLVVRTWGGTIQMRFPEWLRESFCIQALTAGDLTTTLHCSDCPQQSHSQTTSDQCVWQQVKVCSTMALTAGSLAGVQSEREVGVAECRSFCGLLNFSAGVFPDLEGYMCILSLIFLSRVPTIPWNSSGSGGSCPGKQTV